MNWKIKIEMTTGLAEFNRNVGRWVEAQDLSPAKKNVLRLIAYKASMKDWTHFWGIGKLVAWSRGPEAKRLGIKEVSRRTIERHLTEFEGIGLVARKRRTRPTDNRKTSNEYVFRFDRAYIGGKLVGYDFSTGQITPLPIDASNDLVFSGIIAGQEMRQADAAQADRNDASNDLGVHEECAGQEMRHATVLDDCSGADDDYSGADDAYPGQIDASNDVGFDASITISPNYTNNYDDYDDNYIPVEDRDDDQSPYFTSRSSKPNDGKLWQPSWTR